MSYLEYRDGTHIRIPKHGILTFGNIKNIMKLNIQLLQLVKNVQLRNKKAMFVHHDGYKKHPSTLGLN